MPLYHCWLHHDMLSRSENWWAVTCNMLCFNLHATKKAIDLEVKIILSSFHWCLSLFNIVLSLQLRKEMRGWLEEINFLHFPANPGHISNLSYCILYGEFKSEMWPGLAERWRSWKSQSNNNIFFRAFRSSMFWHRTTCRSSFIMMKLNNAAHLYKVLSQPMMSSIEVTITLMPTGMFCSAFSQCCWPSSTLMLCRD